MGKAVMPGCEVLGSQIGDSVKQLRRFMDRFAPCFRRRDTAANAELVVSGLLSNVPKKSLEPIAEFHGVHRRAIQYFVGAAPWDDDLVTETLRRQISDTWGDPDGLIVIDPSTFPKQGRDSVGVARQWCGRLGKVDNCQKGVYAAYVTPRGSALVDRQLYLPEEWVNDPERRDQCHVPNDLEFRTSWEIGAELVDRCRDLPHRFVVADDEFGRATAFRDLLADWGEQYLLNVPSNTLVRRRGGKWMQATKWAKSKGAGSWYRCHLRDGARGPVYVWAIAADVQTKRAGRVGPWERLLVTKTMEARLKISFSLTNASRKEVPLGELVRVAGGRYEIEEVFSRAKGEAGLADYELRSWIGWQHHMTLCMVALWFLELEKERLGGKKPRHHTAPSGLRREGTGSRPRPRSRRACQEDHSATLEG
ncbi:IS701 family transposase [Planctomycetota bacterium]